MFNQYDTLNQEYKEFDSNVILEDEDEFKEFIKSVFGDSKIDYDTTPMSKKTVKQIGMILDKLGLKYKIMTFKDVVEMLGLTEGIEHLSKITCYCVEYRNRKHKDTDRKACLIACFKDLLIMHVSEAEGLLDMYNIGYKELTELIDIIANCCEKVNMTIKQTEDSEEYTFERYMYNLLDILERAECVIEEHNDVICIIFDPAGVKGTLMIYKDKLELITHTGIKTIKIF